jgi:hypothetical protein
MGVAGVGGVKHNGGVVAISEKKVITNFRGCDVCKAYHAVIQNVQIHGSKTVMICFLSACCTVLNMR